MDRNSLRWRIRFRSGLRAARIKPSIIKYKAATTTTNGLRMPFRIFRCFIVVKRPSSGGLLITRSCEARLALTPTPSLKSASTGPPRVSRHKRCRRAVAWIHKYDVCGLASWRVDRQEYQRLCKDVGDRVHSSALEEKQLSRSELGLRRWVL